MNGLHIIADFYHCQYSFLDNDNLITQCIEYCTNGGLTVLGVNQHVFKETNGITFIFLLAESHLSIHTWPEYKSATFDLYTCNYNNNNNDKTKHVYEEIKRIFNPKKINESFIERGSPHTPIDL